MNREYKTHRHTGSDLQKNIQELFFNEIIKDKKKEQKVNKNGLKKTTESGGIKKKSKSDRNLNQFRVQ